MNIKNIVKLLAILMLITFFSCSKDNATTSNPTSNSRQVKYEITGNYTGYINIIYNDNVNGNTSVTVSTLPWTKEINYASNVQGIGIGGSTDIAHPGGAGQSVTVKIYSGDTLLKTTTAVADANGLVNIPTIAYVFP
jgi:hypothetical protein